MPGVFAIATESQRDDPKLIVSVEGKQHREQDSAIARYHPCRPQQWECDLAHRSCHRYEQQIIHRASELPPIPPQ
jgi:hypothetical protein